MFFTPLYCLMSSPPKLMTPEQRDAIKQLAQKYNINISGAGVTIDPATKLSVDYEGRSLEDVHIEYLNILCDQREIITPKTMLSYDSERLALAKMLQIAIRANKHNTSISVTTRIDGKTEKATIKRGRYMQLWLHQINDRLVGYGNTTYAREFKWQKKHKTESWGHEVWGLYTENELNHIIQYETERQHTALQQANNALKVALRAIRQYYRLEGVFSNDTAEPTANEYAFLVYSLVELGIIREDELDINARKGNRERELIRDYFREKRK